MESKKVLFVSQEITPYLPETELSLISRILPQAIQETGKEIRTFMPKYGNINERRNQLHEVIRLSGMNLIIDDTDHPLIIKVASIQAARMQVYFIDNEDYFHRKNTVVDTKGSFFKDNDERMIFFAWESSKLSANCAGPRTWCTVMDGLLPWSLSTLRKHTGRIRFSPIRKWCFRFTTTDLNIRWIRLLPRRSWWTESLRIMFPSCRIPCMTTWSALHPPTPTD